MLIEFTVGNYRSFKEPQTLSFLAATIITEYPENVVNEKGIDLVKTIALYGPNGGGKSNLLKAFATMLMTITQWGNKQSSDDFEIEPFALDTSSASKPSLFELVFLQNDIYYTYGFEITKTQVEKEYLRKGLDSDESIFERTNQEFVLNDELQLSAKDLTNKTRKNALFISVLDMFNNSLVKDIWIFFRRIVFVSGLSNDKQMIYTEQLLNQKETRDEYIEFLKSLDVNIQDLNIIKRSDNMDRRVHTTHNVYNDSGLIIGKISNDAEQFESDGTRNLIAHIGLFLVTVKIGAILVFDELESRLHPFQVLNIIDFFNANSNKAQLLFTTHNTSLLKRGKLRSDQIYFTDKNKMEQSLVYSLSEFKGAKNKLFEEDYLSGRFGAVPFIQNLTTSNES